MRQVIGIFDSGRTGFISRSDFALSIKTFESGLSLEESRMLMNFFDDKNTGKLSVIDLIKAL
jgi:Ca2+-binding EF-hand superfamily protein